MSWIFIASKKNNSILFFFCVTYSYINDYITYFYVSCKLSFSTSWYSRHIITLSTQMKPTFHLEKQNALHSFNNSSPFLEIGKKKKICNNKDIWPEYCTRKIQQSSTFDFYLISLSLSLSLFTCKKVSYRLEKLLKVLQVRSRSILTRSIECSRHYRWLIASGRRMSSARVDH